MASAKPELFASLSLSEDQLTLGIDGPRSLFIRIVCRDEACIYIKRRLVEQSAMKELVQRAEWGEEEQCSIQMLDIK